MGYNATVVVMYDALPQIESDATFGRTLAEAIRLAEKVPNHRVDVPAGNHVNAAHVVEVHHSDASILVAVGQNLGTVQARSSGSAHKGGEGAIRMLQSWADSLGYDVVKRA